MHDVILITTTVENKSDAENIAKCLLEKDLMACAQISGPIQSIYRWEGNIVDGEEFILTIKSLKLIQQNVIEQITAMHPYEVPEIIVQTPDHVSPEYAAWVRRECNG